VQPKLREQTQLRIGSRTNARVDLARSRAFSLIDVIVSLAVVAVLMAILVPSMARVRETTRQVVCSSNVRQVGLGLAMFSGDRKGQLPQSVHSVKGIADPTSAPHMMMQARLGGTNLWDGVGTLFFHDYITAPGVFYCPSHRGSHPLSATVDLWAGTPGSITVNYQYRGPTNPNVRFDTLRSGFSLMVDGLQTQIDFNHVVGANLLRADLAVAWFQDSDKTLVSILPEKPTDADAKTVVQEAWKTLDNFSDALDAAEEEGIPSPMGQIVIPAGK